jgi:predicted DNA-binding protein (MmcQ/YjbR family)
MTKKVDRSEKAILARLRKICLALPQAEEVVTFGHPTFQARKKTFAVLETYRGDLSICFKTDREEQQHRAETDARFYITPYSGKHGWLSLRAYAAPLEWTEVAKLVRQSHALVTSPTARPRRPRSSR